MEYLDLHQFPENHAPSPNGKPVLVVKVGDGTLPADLTLRAVGWIERPRFPTGNVPKECIDALVAALQGGIFSDGCRGLHSCALCHKVLPVVKWKRRCITLQGTGIIWCGMDKSSRWPRRCYCTIFSTTSIDRQTNSWRH